MTDVFKRHGGMPLDTPVFELREILAGSTCAPPLLDTQGANMGGWVKSTARTPS